MKEPYIIAEIGVNHNGDLNTAKRLIDIAAAAGCDSVKFQKRDAKDLLNFNLKTKKPIGY